MEALICNQMKTCRPLLCMSVFPHIRATGNRQSRASSPAGVWVRQKVIFSSQHSLIDQADWAKINQLSVGSALLRKLSRLTCSSRREALQSLHQVIHHQQVVQSVTAWLISGAGRYEHNTPGPAALTGIQLIDFIVSSKPFSWSSWLQAVSLKQNSSSGLQTEKKTDFSSPARCDARTCCGSNAEVTLSVLWHYFNFLIASSAAGCLKQQSGGKSPQRVEQSLVKRETSAMSTYANDLRWA